MNKIKLFSRVVVALAATNTVVVNAESYVIRPGDALWHIAEKKRAQSGFLLNNEQIMLTLYKLNSDAFVNGDINQLVISAKLQIPDNAADYIQLSKAEAGQRLHDKSYLRSLVSSASAINSSKTLESIPTSQTTTPVSTPEYSKVLAALDNHQQAIDGLKVENVRLTKKFNLLERALGRVVMVQGLLTNDMVQVRTKLLDTPTASVKPEMLEKSAVNEVAKIALTNKEKIQAQKILELEAEQLAKLAEPKPDLVVISPLEADNLPVLAKSKVPVAADKIQAKASSPVAPKALPESKDDSWLVNGLIVAGILLTALASWWFLNFYKSRSKRSSLHLDPDIGMPLSDSDNSAFDLSHFDDEPVLQEDAKVPVKAIIEKSQKAIKESGRENELSGVLELLDMCLLCGDYQQAHAVTLKAMSEHKNSPILAKKLIFIERKMAKN